MALLLDDLLDISRITRGTLELRTEVTELSAVVDAAVETARPVIDAKRHSLAIEVPPGPVRFSADPLRLAQVLSNLLTNAAKYTDPEGAITLRASATDDAVTIGVTDTGIGIPADALANVFAMFSQVKSSQDRSEGGLGIGLALARGLVDLHGGSIEARSAGLGQGSEFVVRLPRGRARAERGEVPSTEAAPPAARRRVLIADDNRDAAASLAMLLRMEGHDVTVVHDGVQALEAFKSVRPEVALLDIGMPKLNGYDVARRIREDPPAPRSRSSPSPAGGRTATKPARSPSASTTTSPSPSSPSGFARYCARSGSAANAGRRESAVRSVAALRPRTFACERFPRERC